MNNGTHDGDRERAASIVKNMVYCKKVEKKNPYFNKKI
jgi:hypothetical protein